MTTIGEIVSKLRGSIKEVTDDSKFTNRYLWSSFYINAKQLIKQDADNGRIYSMSDIWEPICVEMEPVSSLYCNCIFLPFNCTVFRSKHQLPSFLESSDGFIYRWIATPDLSKDFVLVTPQQYHNKSKIKYNREKYAFIHDKYLYTPSETYPLITLSALFDGDISDFMCNKKKENTEVQTQAQNQCNTKLSQPIALPSYLESAAIKMTLSELFTSIQVRADELPNSNDTLKDVTP